MAAVHRPQNQIASDLHAVEVVVRAGVETTGLLGDVKFLLQFQDAKAGQQCDSILQAVSQIGFAGSQPRCVFDVVRIRRADGKAAKKREDNPVVATSRALGDEAVHAQVVELQVVTAFVEADQSQADPGFGGHPQVVQVQQFLARSQVVEQTPGFWAAAAQKHCVCGEL